MRRSKCAGCIQVELSGEGEVRCREGHQRQTEHRHTEKERQRGKTKETRETQEKKKENLAYRQKQQLIHEHLCHLKIKLLTGKPLG